ncbi:aminotransferase class I/II-fold pyridoxal phosphate-dependent enzyme [Liberiplasma polymorphum]|uniref:aminotransferase class I/II-fold pyridoxal phosphate-dependent enzyme n=1 Tax=Liberiplasma polymorphum TaxID=3374570 RepID=UPI003771491A
MKNNHQKAPLYDALIQYGLHTQVTPFDVPGHKMGRGIPKRFIDDVGEAIFKIDVNSMKELDSLSNPIGVIKEAEMLAADFFGADHAFFLVNGSTSGVQNMIISTCGDNDKIIMPRNMHKSAYNALILSGAEPIYIDPTIDEDSGISMGVTLEETIKTIDRHPDAKAILLLHPNYFGYTSNLKEIIDYAHSKNMIVLADQSHGSHFSLHESFPISATTLGADLTTISMHKTGGSLTQSSILLHKNGLVPYSRVRSTINIAQTSSASYLLLASLDIARQHLALNQATLFDEMVELSLYAKHEINKIPGFKVLNSSILDGDGIYSHDLTKLTVDVSAYGMTGFKVYDSFKSLYNIQLELGETHVVLAVISVGDTVASIQTLIDAFKSFSQTYPLKVRNGIRSIRLKIPRMVYTPRQAFFKPSTLMELSNSLDCIAADSIMVYPPGIPLVVPGELITQEIIDTYIYLTEQNNIVIGSHHKNDGIYIKVLIP